MRKCPYCLKKISDTARKCKFCGKRVTEKSEVIEKKGIKENLDDAKLVDVVGIGKMLVGWDEGGEDNLKDNDSNTMRILEICVIGLIILLVVIAFIVG